MHQVKKKQNLLGYQDTPKILFTKGGGQWIEAQANSGANALGIDWQTHLGSVRKLIYHLRCMPL